MTDVALVSGFGEALIEGANSSGHFAGYQRDASSNVTAWVKIAATSVSLQGLVSNANGYSFYDAKFIDDNDNLYIMGYKNSSYTWLYLKKN